MPGTFASDGTSLVEVGVSELVMRPGAGVPGGSPSVSRRILQNLVRGSSEPIIARRIGDKWEIIAGDLEYLAALRRGTRVVTIVVEDLDDREAILRRLLEGRRRGELNPLEEAQLCRALNLEYGMTQQEIAMRTGLVQSTVANKQRLLRLPIEVQEALKDGRIGQRHARALLKVRDPDRQIGIYRRAIQSGSSAHEVEEMCSAATPGSARRARYPKRGPKGVVRDIRIYQNGLRSVVKEMQKAGLKVTCDEASDDVQWSFRVLVSSEEETDR